MELTLQAKISAFCREVDDGTLRDLAGRQGMEPVFEGARAALQDGRIGPELESDLDALDAMAAKAEGVGLYPTATRYVPLPVPDEGTGAQWWLCPGDRCTGRGRVRPGQQPPMCALTGEPLVAGPLAG